MFVYSRSDTGDVVDSCIMGLFISHHDQLAVSDLVERPVLRVHVVDAVTGAYLRRPGMEPDRFPSEQQQQAMLDAPGHDTMTTVYNNHLEAFTAVLSYVPATQTQACHHAHLNSRLLHCCCMAKLGLNCRSSPPAPRPKHRVSSCGRRSYRSTTPTKTRSSIRKPEPCSCLSSSSTQRTLPSGARTGTGFLGPPTVSHGHSSTWHTHARAGPRQTLGSGASLRSWTCSCMGAPLHHATAMELVWSYNGAAAGLRWGSHGGTSSTYNLRRMSAARCGCGAVDEPEAAGVHVAHAC